MRALALAVCGLALLASSAAACQNAAVAAVPGAEARHARAVRCLLNEQRAAFGVPRLRGDERLADAALGHSRAMVRERFFAHLAPGGSSVGARVGAAGYAWRAVGETIAWGAGALSAPREVVAAWMGSPGHRAIILDRTYREVGIGVAADSPGGAGRAATVTADFATAR